MTHGGASQLHRLRTLHLFAGAGGGVLSDLLLGHRPVCAAEINEYCQQVLSARQENGILPWFPIFADVTKFDGRPWRGLADVVCGGFPCQDISAAGKGVGIDGERSGLWREMARVIGEVRPQFAFVENSPMLTSRGLGRVLGDLAEIGYDAEWTVYSAADCGAPHLRERIWILAYARNDGAEWRQSQPRTCETGRDVADHHGIGGREQSGRRGQGARPIGREDSPDAGDSRQVADTASAGSAGLSSGAQPKHAKPYGGGRSAWWESDPADRNENSRFGLESRLGRVANGVANRVDRLKALGNGQVPVVAASAWRELYARLGL